MTNTQKVQPAICKDSHVTWSFGYSSSVPCSRPAELGGKQCAEHCRMVDEFEYAYDL